VKISTLTEGCAMHKQHKISIYVDITDAQRDMVEGALNGFLNTWDQKYFIKSVRENQPG
tara:strand:- start:530 stop:706 length:177 start_codon:yes stop_codon:yes gene_type:complete